MKLQLARNRQSVARGLEDERKRNKLGGMARYYTKADSTWIWGLKKAAKVAWHGDVMADCYDRSMA